mgnify:CR=1 FL=1
MGQKVALLECAKSHLADVQNRAIKLRDPNFKQFNNDYPIQINVSTEKVDNFSMKFSKPRVLLENLYPDWEEAQPALFKKFVSEFAFPEDTSKMGKFLDSAINYLKSRQKEKSKKIEPRGNVAPNEFLSYRLVQFDHCGGHLLGSTQLDFCALYLVDIEYVQCFTPLVRAFGISQ